ncbi:MAG: hypothetical protein D6794_02390, partial [Deltaproteobacteria bacterium]
PVLKDLQRRGFLAGTDEHRRLSGCSELFLRWELGYSDRLREALGLKRCRWQKGRNLKELPAAIERLAAEEGILVGGELGACLLLGTEEDIGQATLHCRGDMLRLMLRLELVPDPEGPVHLLQRFGMNDRWRGWQPFPAPLADPLFLHAEIAAVLPHREELLRQIYDRYLQPRLTDVQEGKG